MRRYMEEDSRIVNDIPDKTKVSKRKDDAGAAAQPGVERLTGLHGCCGRVSSICNRMRVTSSSELTSASISSTIGEAVSSGVFGNDPPLHARSAPGVRGVETSGWSVVERDTRRITGSPSGEFTHGSTMLDAPASSCRASAAIKSSASRAACLRCIATISTSCCRNFARSAFTSSTRTRRAVHMDCANVRASANSASLLRSSARRRLFVTFFSLRASNSSRVLLETSRQALRSSSGGRCHHLKRGPSRCPSLARM
jgi:hypothetical protein